MRDRSIYHQNHQPGIASALQCGYLPNGFSKRDISEVLDGLIEAIHDGGIADPLHMEIRKDAFLLITGRCVATSFTLLDERLPISTSASFNETGARVDVFCPTLTVSRGKGLRTGAG